MVITVMHVYMINVGNYLLAVARQVWKERVASWLADKMGTWDVSCIDSWLC